MTENTALYANDECENEHPRTTVRGGTYMIAIAAFGLLIACLLCIGEPTAPKLNAGNTFGYTPYRFAENGSFFDHRGVIKGWIRGNTVYDPLWNVRYHIRNKRLYKPDEEEE